MIEIIQIPEIRLEWVNWVKWDDLKLDARKDREAPNPPAVAGVYEAKINDCDESLIIGRASNLRGRLKEGMVKGSVGHPPGKRLREKEVDNLSRVVVRWAETERPAAVEEYLLKKHQKEFKRLPKYVHSI